MLRGNELAISKVTKFGFVFQEKSVKISYNSLATVGFGALLGAGINPCNK